MAQECLGFAPQRGSAAGSGERAFAARLIQAVEEEFRADQARIAHALKVFQHAKELVRAEGGDPCVVLAAALLLEAAVPGPAQREGSIGGSSPSAEGLAKVKGMLDRIGLGADPSRRVCEMIDSYWTGKPLDTVEFQIVCDADRLAKWTADSSTADPDERENAITAGFRTNAGRKKARSMFQA
jgi:hypothetical protein